MEKSPTSEHQPEKKVERVVVRSISTKPVVDSLSLLFPHFTL
jgi:hypothetical protein